MNSVTLPVVGQEVYVCHGASFRNLYTKRTITNVTKSGMVDVAGKRFGVDGRERGVTTYRYDWLEFDLAKIDAILADRKVAQDVAAKLNEIMGIGRISSYSGKAQLALNIHIIEKALAEAKAELAKFK